MVNHGGMSVALPTIARHFNADLTTAQWVIIAEGLAISALILPMGRLSDVLGRKRVLITGMSLFSAGAALASVSPGIGYLIAFMALQGLGAAMLQGTAIAIVTSVFPEDERGKGIGSHGSVAGAGGVLGPVLGGLLITAFDWRWIFYANASLAIVAIVAAACLIRSEVLRQDTRSPKYDFTGAALSAVVLLTFLLAVSNGSQMGWTSGPILAAALGFALFMAVFVWWELRSDVPLLDLRLFRSRVFSIGLSTNFMSFVATTSARFLLPFYLQGALGYTPAVVGLVLLPNAASRIVLGVVGGHLSDRFGRRPFTVAGLLLSATGLFVLASLSVSSSLVHVLVGVLLQSAGTGLFPVAELRFDIQRRGDRQAWRRLRLRKPLPKLRYRDGYRGRHLDNRGRDGRPRIRARHQRSPQFGPRHRSAILVHGGPESGVHGNGSASACKCGGVFLQQPNWFAADRFRRVNEAYRVLSSPLSRSEYDRERLATSERMNHDREKRARFEQWKRAQAQKDPISRVVSRTRYRIRRLFGL